MGVLVGTGIAAWTSVFAAALLCAIQLVLSGTVPLAVAIPAMAGWHILIGLGEAAITVIAISYVLKTRPDLLHRPPLVPRKMPHSVGSR
jgi:cobalt/nickel transport system permease protein